MISLELLVCAHASQIVDYSVDSFNVFVFCNDPQGLIDQTLVTEPFKTLFGYSVEEAEENKEKTHTGCHLTF